MRTCTACSVEVGPYQRLCAPCRRIRRNATALRCYYRKHAERKAKMLQWHKDNPEKSERNRQKYRQTEKHRAGHRVRSNRYHDKLRQDPERWAFRNRQMAHKRRMRMCGNPNYAPFTLEQWKEKLITAGNRCHYCHAEFSDQLPPTQDHMVPLSRGGAHAIENVVPACRPCNVRKNDQLVDAFQPAA